MCSIGAKYVKQLDWTIALTILGIIEGGLGGVLVILGVMLGLVSKLTHE